MTKKRIAVDIEVLRYWFTYEPDTGLVRWRVKPKGQRRQAGDVAGNVDKIYGYVQIRLDYQKLYGHRVAWALHHGEWPNGEIDHINLNRGDNRITNLRVATHRQNMQNLPIAANKCGLPGIHKTSCGYSAKIRYHGTVHYLGHFKTAEQAHVAYVQKAQELRTEFFNEQLLLRPRKLR